MTCCTVELHPNTTGVARIVVTYSAQSVADLGLSSAYINDATCTFDLWDKNNNQLVTALSLTLITESPANGVYRGNIPDDIGVVLSKEYKYQFSVELSDSTAWTKTGKLVATNPD